MTRTVYMMYGYLGAGKTTHARKLAKELGAVRLSPDEEMVAMHGEEPPADDWGHLERGIKTRLWKRAAEAVVAGQDVILDFGFWQREERDEARRQIARLGARAVLVWVQCDPAEALRRMVARSAQENELRIDAAVFEAMKPRFEALGFDEPHEVVRSA
jgi:predicted kinase